MAAYRDKDAEDAEALGDVGELTGAAADYYPIWAIIDHTGASLTEIETAWTLERITAFMAYLDMKRDYKAVWSEYFQQQAQKEKDG